MDKNSIILFYGDHGESFDHYTYYTHGDALYNSTVKIPLLLHMPGNHTSKRISQLVQNTDIFATVLELLGISGFETADSISFRNVIRPKSTDLFSSFQDGNRKEIIFVNVNNSKYAIVNSRYKYIYSFPFSCIYPEQTEELYDITNDPNEINNILSREPAVARDMKQKLFGILAGHNLPPAQAGGEEEDTNIDLEKLEVLKSLGY